MKSCVCCNWKESQCVNEYVTPKNRLPLLFLFFKHIPKNHFGLVVGVLFVYMGDQGSILTCVKNFRLSSKCSCHVELPTWTKVMTGHMTHIIQSALSWVQIMMHHVQVKTCLIYMYKLSWLLNSNSGITSHV